MRIPYVPANSWDMVRARKTDMFCMHLRRDLCWVGGCSHTHTHTHTDTEQGGDPPPPIPPPPLCWEGSGATQLGGLTSLSPLATSLRGFGVGRMQLSMRWPNPDNRRACGPPALSVGQLIEIAHGTANAAPSLPPAHAHRPHLMTLGQGVWLGELGRDEAGATARAANRTAQWSQDEVRVWLGPPVPGNQHGWISGKSKRVPGKKIKGGKNTPLF